MTTQASLKTLRLKSVFLPRRERPTTVKSTPRVAPRTLGFRRNERSKKET